MFKLFKIQNYFSSMRMYSLNFSNSGQIYAKYKNFKNNLIKNKVPIQKKFKIQFLKLKLKQMNGCVIIKIVKQLIRLIYQNFFHAIAKNACKKTY